MTIQPPDPSSRVVDPQARIDPIWDRFLRNLWRRVADNDVSITALQAGRATLEQPWSWSTLIQTPANTSYVFPNVLPNGLIEEITTVTSSGTCTVQVLIDGTTMTGPSNSASTTEQTTYQQNGEMPQGGKLTITITNNSSAANLAVVVRGSQTLEV